LNPDEIVEFELIRKTNTLSVSVSLSELNNDLQRVNKRVFPGFTLVEKDNGIFVYDILTRSLASQSGINSGNKILEFNNEKITNYMDFYNNIIIGENIIKYERNNEIFEVTISL